MTYACNWSYQYGMARLTLINSTAVDRCQHALREAILGGAFAPGSRLPPERVLAEQYQVNRVTIRGALSRLTASGLVSVRQGSGYQVRDFRREGGPGLIPSLLELCKKAADVEAVVSDLLLVRRHLAAAALEKLSGGVEPRALARIAEAVDVFSQGVERGAPPHDLAEMDLEILARVAEATGSAVLQLCLNPIAGVLLRLPRLQAAIYRSPRDNLVSYALLQGWLARPERSLSGAILDALRAHDAATLAALQAVSGEPR